jgi:hypothetical protein
MGCLLVLAGPNQGDKGIITSASLLLPFHNKRMGDKKMFCCLSESKPLLMLQALHSGEETELSACGVMHAHLMR